MRAYHNDQAIKDTYLLRVQTHQEQDEIIKGKYWQGGKGCAVGCTIHSSNHNAYEKELGIPEMLARLEDTIFEGLSNNLAKLWPAKFLNVINLGADLSRVGYQFMYWNLTENLILRDSDNEEVQKVIVQCREAVKQCSEAICPLTKGESFSSAAWSAESAARSAAWSAASAARSAASAAWSAESAARSAAWSAESAARSAAWSAASAARSAAWSAESAARSAASAASAARSAAWSAESAARSAASAAWSAESAASAARSAAYEKMADKLIELLRNAI